jgi:hypothetical protein
MPIYQPFSPLTTNTVTSCLYANLVVKLLKPSSPHCLGEQVYQLLCRRRVPDDDGPFLDAVPKKMLTNVNVFALLLQDWDFCRVQ